DGVHDLLVEPGADGTRARFDVDNDHVEPVLRALTDLGLRSVTVTPPSLEELFLRHYGDELAQLDGAGAL
ncbi:ABC transporter ATP-binding protein, partial [Cellulosimicrobium sp. AB352]